LGNAHATPVARSLFPSFLRFNQRTKKNHVAMAVGIEKGNGDYISLISHALPVQEIRLIASYLRIRKSMTMSRQWQLRKFGAGASGWSRPIGLNRNP
jgi:hypothetical protein